MLWQDNSAKLLGLQDAIIKDVEVENGTKIVSVEMPRRGHKCPACGQMTSTIHDYRMQSVKDVPGYGGRVRLLLRKRRYRCECGKRFFEEIPFLPRYYRMTNRMSSAIIDSCADVRSYTSVARQFDVSVSTVIRIFDVVYYPKRELPKVLAIDEFKGNTGGEKFNVILTDPETGEVLDILPKRYAYHLSSYFRTMNRRNVEFFVSDMWRTYADTASVYFPSATQIVDKYHWMRQVIWAFEAVRKEEQKRLGYHYRKCFKHSRKLMLKRFEYLTDEQKVQVNAMLAASARLNSAHFLKERFQAIVDEKNPESAIKALSQWVFHAENSAIYSFVNCAKTFHHWFPGIANSLRYSYTNAFTEGCNNKIKVLKRNAYGFRNFRRFRNRILHMFSYQNLDKRWQTVA